MLCVSQQELCSLWCELQRHRPELLNILEGVLVHTVSNLQDSIRERDNLEQALRRSLPPSSHCPPQIQANTHSFCPVDATLNIQTIVLSFINSFNFNLLCFRRESEHDQVVRSIYEEMENQIREEKDKHLAQVQMCAI